MALLAVLPLIAYGLLLMLLRRKGQGWRESVLFASIPWALFLAWATEVLSAFHQVTRAAATGLWMFFIVACLILVVRSAPRGHKALTKFQIPPEVVKSRWSVWLPIAGIAIIVALVGLTALVCAPNNWDAMEYHLPRVFEWMNYQSVGLYPTIDRQQLDMPPWAEYAMLHFDLLFGGDRLVNLVQWFAFLGCILGVSLIAKELGSGSDGQIFAAVLGATIPSAVLGASGPKNDQALSFWIVLAVVLLLRWRSHSDWWHALAIGASAGLALFTKGSTLAFLPPFVVCAWFMWDRRARLRFLARSPVMAIIGLVLIVPLWYRNYTFSGSVLGLPYFDGAGPEKARMFANDHITVTRTAAAIIRNITLHLGVPNARVNEWTTRIASSLIWKLGVDPNDPGQIVGSQAGYVPNFAVKSGGRNEVLAGDLVHLFLFLAAACYYLAKRRQFDCSAGFLLAGIVGAFCLFSALLRWGPWNGRYHLVLFFVAAAWIGATFTQIASARTVAVITYFLLLLSIPFALMNSSRPLIPFQYQPSIFKVSRDQTYFMDAHLNMSGAFISAAHFVQAQNCDAIGLDANLLRFEYPILALVSADGKPRDISYTSVANSTARFKSANTRDACLVICLGCVNAADKREEYHARTDRINTFGDEVVVFQTGAQLK